MLGLAGCFLEINKMKLLKTPFILLLILISFLFSNCKKESAGGIAFPNSDSKQLVGTWNWVESSGGFSGATINPSTEGYSKQIGFSENGHYYESQNGKEVLILNYSFEENKSIYNSQIEYMIKYKSPSANMINDVQSFDFLGSDSLFLSDECYDCYGHLYIREK